MKEEEIDVAAFEAALIKYAGQETLDIIQKREAQRRADAIEKATAPLYEGLNENRQHIEKLHDVMARDEWEKQRQAGAKVHDQESYESYLKERQILIDTKAAIEKQEKARASKLVEAEKEA